jgi:DNA ligase-3
VTEYLPKATDADSIILDGEILLMDTQNRKPLPFGTLGIHKKTAFKDATGKKS